MFDAGSKVKVMDIANVRYTPGYSNKDASDVFAAVHPGEVLTVISGPHPADGLDWYELDIDGAINGFVAESVHGEVILVADDGAAPWHGGAKQHATDGGVAGILLTRPVDHSIVISQLWGENPEFYAQIQGYAAPLQGHNGVDFAATHRSIVMACDDGVVERAGMDPWGFGELVVVRHAWGKSYYAHNDEIIVGVGDSVARGQQISWSGCTGLGMGAGGAGQDHLHFSIKIDGQDDSANGWGGFSNPMDYADGEW